MVNGSGLLLYFPFKRTFFLNVFSDPSVKGILCLCSGYFRVEALLAFCQFLLDLLPHISRGAKTTVTFA